MSVVTSLLFSMWTFKVKPAGFKDFKVLTLFAVVPNTHFLPAFTTWLLPSGWVEIYPLTGRQRHDACRGTFSCSLNVLPSVSLHRPVNVMDCLEVDSGWRDESKLLRQPTDFINKQLDSTTMNFQKKDTKRDLSAWHFFTWHCKYN